MMQDGEVDAIRSNRRAGPVLRRIAEIIGVRPSRRDLVGIAEHLRWGTLERLQKRVRAALVARIESMADTILPFLETHDGVKALQTAFVQIIRAEQSAAPWARPPETSVEFYLN
jgi:hypothetical protein